MRRIQCATPNKSPIPHLTKPRPLLVFVDVRDRVENLVCIPLRVLSEQRGLAI